MTRDLFIQHCVPGSIVTIERNGKQWAAEVASHTRQLLVLKNRKTDAPLRINTQLYVLDIATSHSIRLLRADGEVITVITPATNWDKVLAAHKEEVRKSFLSQRRDLPPKPKRYTTIAITDKQITAARALGDGNLSLGIRRAIATATGVEATEIKSIHRSGKKNRPRNPRPSK